MPVQIEGSQAVAAAVAACRPQVIGAYPISPQTHIVETLSKLVKSGELPGCEYINVEFEFAAMSVCIGASATGARTYTATASQGLLYMVEAVYNASGLGLPIVMTVANRAIGAHRGVVEVDASMMTGRPGLFAGGDMVPSDRTVTVAVGHGKTAASHIDAWLRGTTYAPAPKPALAAFDNLTPWYYSDAPHAVRPQLEGARRVGTFDEVVQGLDAESALFEARRCLSCGNCFGCDNCFDVCPDNAVKKIGAPGPGGYEFDFCKGCGLCVAECPCGAITMVPEE